jgi:hypothetical protein
MGTIYTDEVTLTVTSSGIAVDSVESASETSAPALGVIHNVLANGVESASEVSVPFAEEVQTAPTITNQPDDITVQLPYDGELFIEALGVNGHALTYQWYLGADDSVISGATTDTLTITMIDYADDGTTYYCIVTDAVEPAFFVQSNTVTMTVLEAVAANGTAIKTKVSHTGGAVPTTANLSEGELAINTADGKIYSRDDSNNIVTLGGLQDGSTLPTSDPAVAGALWNDNGAVKISVG